MVEDIRVLECDLQYFGAYIIIDRSCVLGRFWVETLASMQPLLRVFMVFHVTAGIIRQIRERQTSSKSLSIPHTLNK